MWRCCTGNRRRRSVVSPFSPIIISLGGRRPTATEDIHPPGTITPKAVKIFSTFIDDNAVPPNEEDLTNDNNDDLADDVLFESSEQSNPRPLPKTMPLIPPQDSNDALVDIVEPTSTNEVVAESL